MSAPADLQPALRQRAADIVGQLSGPEREALLIKCWMSHDARWFMAVAGEHGIQAAGRLNQVAAHETGKAEARRIVRALQLPPVTAVDDYLLVQEILISLLGPELLDYGVTKVGDDALRIHVHRCFAADNAQRAGIADQYECGIFARSTGWLDALDLTYELTPPLGKCPKAQGQECVYTLSLSQEAQSPSGSGSGS
ncbi:MAG: hypothetical protein A2148_05050 [Chloroflexi bacterium RBG_16_68_14]|nr:MAG: hypothetical protein A2148_05050 [Chloroflexi bacterium RBG_16_68_14]